MSAKFDEVFDAYERGAITRRDVLAAVASLLALGSGAVAAPALALEESTGEGRAHLNHVNLRVENVERSFRFYHELFGLGLKQTPTYAGLDCGGGTFISLQTQANVEMETFRTSPDAVEWAKTPKQSPGMIEHFCLELDDFDLEKTRAELKARGHETVEISGNLLTADPDGILVQLVDSKIRFLHEE